MMRIGRRSFGAALLSLGAASGLAMATSTEASPAPLDLSTDEARLNAYIRMRGALTDRVIAGYTNGRYYGVIDSEMRPLFGVQAATLARFRPHAGGGWETVGVEQAYFTDLETGQVLQTLVNPYTGETVPVPVTQSAPVKLVISPDLNIRPQSDLPGMSLEDRVARPEIRGDDVWMVEETSAAITFPGRAKPFRYQEILTLQASVQDLASSGADRVPTRVGYDSIVSWRPWLKMGDHPGHLIGIGHGAIGLPLSDMSSVWLSATEKDRPQFLTDPKALMAPLWDAQS